jgi:hypothetical protein
MQAYRPAIPITKREHYVTTNNGATMKPGGGKSKGNGFEGLIAKKLGVALAPLSFIRSPGSGARVGGKNFEKFGEMFGADALKLFVADVVPINESKTGLCFLHSIECKAYKTPDNFTSLANGKANIFKWFEESVVDAAKINKNPLLIFKWNQTAVFVAADMSKLSTAPRCCPSIKLEYAPESGRLTKQLTIYLLDDLLKEPDFWCDRE